MAFIGMVEVSDGVEDDFFDIDAACDAESHITSNELSITRSKLGDLLDLMPAGLLIHQEQGIVYANQEAERILGADAQSLVGRHLFDFLDEDSLPEVRRFFTRCLTQNEPARAVDCTLTGPDGARVYVQLSMSVLPWEGLPVLYVLINDVDALKSTEAVLRRLSITDSLTGAYNRRHFIEEGQRELERARRYSRPLSILLMDLDYFKQINDTYGHMTGDEVLRRFVVCCQRLLRNCDVLGRLGGEEFAILLPETDIAGAAVLAERIRAAVEQIVIENERGPVRITVSIGASGCATARCSVDELLSSADKALYRAKSAGRNRVECDPSPPSALPTGCVAA
jgi:diguanylate cyclase